jgi:pentatricopeptide repeat protein
MGFLQEMHAAGCQANVVTYTGIIDAFGKARRYEEMERVWTDMKAQGVKPDLSAFIAIIGAYGRGGLYKRMEARFHDLQVGWLAVSFLEQFCWQFEMFL